VQFSTYIHEGRFRIWRLFPATFTSTKTVRFTKTKYFDDIGGNYKLKSLIPCSECVTRNDFIRQSVTEGKREIKLVITAVRDTHCIVHWYIEVNTDLNNGDVIVSVTAIVICIYDYSCNCMDSSTSIWISGASPHRESADRYPVDSKIMK